MSHAGLSVEGILAIFLSLSSLRSSFFYPSPCSPEPHFESSVSWPRGSTEVKWQAWGPAAISEQSWGWAPGLGDSCGPLPKALPFSCCPSVSVGRSQIPRRLRLGSPPGQDGIWGWMSSRGIFFRLGGGWTWCQTPPTHPTLPQRGDGGLRQPEWALGALGWAFKQRGLNPLLQHLLVQGCPQRGPRGEARPRPGQSSL